MGLGFSHAPWRAWVPERPDFFFEGQFSEASAAARRCRPPDAEGLGALVAYFHAAVDEAKAETTAGAFRALSSTVRPPRAVVWAGDTACFEPDAIAKQQELKTPCIAVMLPLLGGRRRHSSASEERRRLVEWPLGNVLELRAVIELAAPALGAAAAVEAALFEVEDSLAASSWDAPELLAKRPPELLNAAAECGCCSLCLDDIAEEAQTFLLPCCSALAHRACVGRWILSQAEEGWWPCRCPVRGCRRAVSDVVMWSTLSTTERQRYNALLAQASELRSCGGARRVESPRTEGKMQRLGLRRCPGCHCWLEKRRDVAMGHLLDGCDLVTCRCGAQLCWRCGARDAACSCPGNHGHQFFSRQEVLEGYPMQSAVERARGPIHSVVEQAREATGWRMGR